MLIKNALEIYLNSRNLKRKIKTVSQDFMHLTDFIFYLRDTSREVESITLEECEAWLRLAAELRYDPNTIIKKAIAIKLFFEHLIKRRVYTQFDPELIPIPRKIFKFPRVASEEQYKKLLEVIPERGYYHVRNRAMIMMLHDSGARNGEVVSLDLNDLNLVKMSARVKTEKSRGTVPFREIFWGAETNEKLKEWLKAREKMEIQDKEAVFVGIKGDHRNCPGKGHRLQVNFVSEILRKYSYKAKLPIINPHSFRHLFGRDLSEKGANAFEVSSLLGHARVESSYPYTMLFGKRRGDAYRRYRDKGI